MELNDISVEDGTAKLHVRHPGLKHPMYHGEGADKFGRVIDKDKPHDPVTITVRAYDSAKVRDVLKANGRRAMQAKPGDDDGSKAGDDLVDALIADWFGITECGAPMPCNRANKIRLLNANPDIDVQVFRFSKDQANFFEAAASD